MAARDAAGMIQHFWSAVIGTERSIGLAARKKQEGFDRFEEVLEEFRVKFDDAFLKAPSPDERDSGTCIPDDELQRDRCPIQRRTKVVINTETPVPAKKRSIRRLWDHRSRRA